MADIRDSIDRATQAGITHVPVNPIYTGINYSGRSTWKRFDINPIQTGWHEGIGITTVNASPWSFISAPEMQNIDVQRAIQNYEAFGANLGVNPFLVMDIETTGTNMQGRFFSPTEVAMGVYDDFGKQRGLLNMAIAPTSKFGTYRDLLRRARRGALSGEERYAALSFLRYSSPGSINANHQIVSHSELFNPDIVRGTSPFTKEQLKGMRRGLFNLMRGGVPEHEVAQRIQQFFEANNLHAQKFSIVGHNIENFDIPGLSGLIGHDKWLQLSANANSVVDTLSLSRMVSGDPSVIYRRYLYDQFRRQYGEGPLSQHHKRLINREVKKAMRSIDLQNAGMLTMDALRKLTGVESQGAHLGAIDVIQEEKVFHRLHPIIQRMVHEGLVDARSGLVGGKFRPSMVDKLRYSTRPMNVGDYFISMGGLESRGLDFSITDEGDVLSKWVLNSKAVYQFQGFFQDAGQGVFGAKFYSPHLRMTSYLTGSTLDEVRRKIQGGTLQFIRPEDIGSLPQQVLNDLARQNINKWDYERMRKFVGHYQGSTPLDTFVERRTFETIRERLGSEVGALSAFINKAEASGLTAKEKNLAFRLFYDELNRHAPLPQEFIDRSWDATAPIFGRNVSLRSNERFVGSVFRALDAEIPSNVSPRTRERSRLLRFNALLGNLSEQGYLMEGDISRINSIKGAALKNKIESLRVVLSEPGRAIRDAMSVPVESMKARIVQLDVERAAEIASNAIQRTITQTRGITDGSMFGGILSSANPYSSKMLDAIDKITKEYEKQGFGVHVADVSGHLRLFLSEDKTGFDAVTRALNQGTIPAGAFSVEIPGLTRAGHIVYGAETRINPAGRLYGNRKRVWIKDLYEESIDAVVRRAEKVRNLLMPGEGLTPDMERARRMVSGGIRDIFGTASGVSRATTFEAFEESNRLDVRGNFADVLRRKQVNVQAMFGTIMGTTKTWDEASMEETTEFLETFLDRARDLYRHNPEALEMINRLGIEGVKEEKFRKAFFSLASERDFTPFGVMSSASRPNLVQWLNFYGYSTDELNRKLTSRARRFGSLQGMSLNPYLVSRTEAEAYLEMSASGKAFAPGISVGALQLSSKEYMDVISSPEGRRILSKYGLSVDDVTGTGTWEQGVIASPEMRRLLEGRQPKTFEVYLDDIEAGRSRLSSSVDEWIKSGGKRPLRLSKDQTLFEDIIETMGGTRTVATTFDDDIGRLMSFEEMLDAEGRRMLRLNAEAIYPMATGTKVMFDTRKGTMSFFGPAGKSVRASKAMHELFGEDTHLIYLGNVKKHLDVAADIRGQIAELIKIYQFDKKTMDDIAAELTASFGTTSVIQLPGREGWTIQVPDATQMVADARINPQYVQNEISRITQKFGLQNQVVLPGGLSVTRSTVELRRANVNETYRVSSYLGEGLSSGAGLKIGPREIRSLRSKGMIIGADMDPLIQYLMAEGDVMPGRAAYATSASDMSQAIGALVHPERMAALPTKKASDLEAFARFKGQKWFLQEQLTEGAGTILGQSEMFALELPVAVDVSVGPGRQGYRRLTSLPIARQILKPDERGRIFLGDQSRSLMNLYEAIESYESFNVTDAPHGEFATRAQAEEAIQKYTRKYIDALGRDISSSEGMVAEHAIKYRVSSSGRLKAQNISANLQLDENLSGTVKISRDLMDEMFGVLPADSPVRQALYSDQGFYGLLMRDPNESAWNFAVMNYRVDPNLRGRVARMSATEAAMMGADFDGDQVGFLSPYTKRMERLLNQDPQAFNQLQMQLGSIHRKQTQYNRMLAQDIRGRFAGEASIKTPGQFAQLFNEMAASHDILAGDAYRQRVMSAHLSKSAAGPLYNVAHRYGDVGMAIFEGISDPVERAQRVELLNMFTEATTERLSLKGKMGSPLHWKEVSTLRTDLLRAGEEDAVGQTLSTKWRKSYAQAMSDNTAVAWSGTRSMLAAEGVSTWAEASPELQERIKLTLADKMLRNVEDIRETAMRSGFGSYFTQGNVASRMFFSDQAYNERFQNLAGMYDQFLNIRPDDEGFMKSFVPTGYAASMADITGQTQEFLAAKQQFYDRLKIVNTLDSTDTIKMVEEASQAVDAIQQVQHAVNDAVDEASLWKKMPGWLKAGGLVVGGVAALGAIGSLTRKEPRPELVPSEKEFDGPTARIQMNNEPPKMVNGQKITVRAKNERNISLDNIADSIKQNINEGNVNIYQKDDTQALTQEWMEQLFTNAIRHGRGPSGTPNTY